jgi:hypothetical protein
MSRVKAHEALSQPLRWTVQRTIFHLLDEPVPASICCHEVPGKRTRRSLTYAHASASPSRVYAGASSPGPGVRLSAALGHPTPDFPPQSLQLSLQCIQLGVGDADQFVRFGARVAPSVLDQAQAER